MKIAVLGGGNGSHAAAVDLTEAGHEVRLWRRDAAGIASLEARGRTLTLKDHTGERPVTLAMATTDIDLAIDGAELIVCPTPNLAQGDIARRLAPHLVDGQVIFMPPGTFGTVLMAQIVRDEGNLADVTYAEAGTLPYLCRLHGPETVAITTRATRLPTGIFPARNAEHAFSILRRAYPSVEDAGDGLSGALMNAGPIIHPPLIVMNAGPIEHFEHWDIHNEGTQPSVRRVTTALDNERIAIREALGYGEPHFPLSDHYDNEAEEWMYGNAAHERLVDSGDWREDLDLITHRYMREDLLTGLSFMTSVADWCGVPAPVATGLHAIGSAICDTGEPLPSRTLHSLGLNALTRSEMFIILWEGFE